MNRLILIGNGFDLAHGLKTSYNDFILWYLNYCFTMAFENQHYTDGLIKIRRTPNYLAPLDLVDTDGVTNLINTSYNNNGFKDLLDNRSFGSGKYQLANPFNVDKDISPFLRTLLLNCTSSRWVDIENYYYRILKEILDTKSNVVNKESRLNKLNQSLDILISHLENYLKTQNAPQFIKGYVDIISTSIKKSEVHGIKLEWEPRPKNILLLNFNYTATPLMYLDRVKYKSRGNLEVTPTLNFIHGKIDDTSNPIIFGFGDELDDYYLRMEREEAKGFYDHIKSFWYFKTSNYRNLVTFIDAEPYQVCILGHSCGLSDRTMLHMLFEHENCKSIKIYFHGDKDGKNNYTELTHEIARHFKDKVEMRNKIVSLDRSSPMPQAN